jgi:predicted O-methyltransferase YrrM
MKVPAFHEEWFGDSSQAVLAHLVQAVADVPGLLVEFGSWEGRSTCAMARAAYPRQVLAVDTWQGSPGEISSELAAKRDVFAQFLANVTHWTRGNVEPVRMGWRDWVADRAEPVALAFIDAEHTYREVFDNIAAVLPLIQPGGVICGDDAHHPPVMEAVRELLEPVELSASLWIWRAP